MNEAAKKATDYFSNGYHCAQSVLASCITYTGYSEEDAFRIAKGFGSGIARRQEICGAVSGMLMALGMYKDSEVNPSLKADDTFYARENELIGRFIDQFGSINCRELIEVDISTPEGLAKARKDGVFSTKCTELVKGAAHILEDYITS